MPSALLPGTHVVPASHRESRSGEVHTVALLTGCKDPHYAFGLATALASLGIHMDMIGDESGRSAALSQHPNITFHALRGNRQSERILPAKLLGWLRYYIRLLQFARPVNCNVVHILWNSKFQALDRTLLMLYYRLLGVKIALTAHNVNQARRDMEDSLFNRLTLRVQYRLSHHIFVHTEPMKAELCSAFGVRPSNVTVIPYGINNAVADTGISCASAKAEIGVGAGNKTILVFGGIKPYKGIEYVVEAFSRLTVAHPEYRLVIAGERKKDAEAYFNDIQRRISDLPDSSRVIQNIRYISDKDIEIYFKAADVLALPYKNIFQSGILFLAYSFGLPVVASDLDAFRDDIIEGKTGFVCKTNDPADLAKTLERYFASDLFLHLQATRPYIRDTACVRHSWQTVGELTKNVYSRMLVRADSERRACIPHDHLYL